MVHTDLVPDFKVEILINDEVCEEHSEADADGDPAVITKYIASSSGARWAIRIAMGLAMQNSGYSWSLEVLADGESLNHYSLFTPTPGARYDDKRPMELKIDQFEYNVGDLTYFSDFRFRDIKTCKRARRMTKTGAR